MQYIKAMLNKNFDTASVKISKENAKVCPPLMNLR